MAIQFTGASNYAERAEAAEHAEMRWRNGNTAIDGRVYLSGRGVGVPGCIPV